MKLKILDKIFRTGKRDVAKEQGVTDRSMQKEFKTYVNKSKELLETAKIIEKEHKAGKHSVKSIGGLKQQISNLQSAERELQHSLKKLSDLPHHMTKLLNEQINCIKILSRLEQKNHTFLNKLEKRGTVKKSTIDKKIAIDKAIKDLREKVKKNNAEIEDFHSGNTVKKLKNYVNNNLRNFKEEVAQLELEIKSIEIRDNLQELAGYFNNHGAYDEVNTNSHCRTSD